MDPTERRPFGSVKVQGKISQEEDTQKWGQWASLKRASLLREHPKQKQRKLREEAVNGMLEIEPLVVDRERNLSFIPLLPIPETLARHKPATVITTQL